MIGPGGHVDELSIVYVTTSSREEAERIAEDAIRSKLAACANIITDVSSIFFWDGKMQKEQECIILLKTRRSIEKELSARIKNVHSYDCPCIVSVSFAPLNMDFGMWVKDSTVDAGDGKI